LVSLERGEIGRRIFADEDIFEQEMELIFARAWQFLCHETQIPKPGDFFETPVGRDNVLTVRQRDGSIKALLNTCPHRGNAVCRAEEGNTKAFMCTYHGWSFDLAGNLIGVPDLDRFYKGDLDKSKHGMVRVPQMTNYKGFIFARMDDSAPPLEDYLGPTGRLSLDLLAVRDVKIVPGVQKFMIDCNWRFAVDNVADWYHAQITHMSAPGMVAGEAGAVVDAGGATDTLGQELKDPVWRIRRHDRPRPACRVRPHSGWSDGSAGIIRARRWISRGASAPMLRRLLVPSGPRWRATPISSRTSG